MSITWTTVPVFWILSNLAFLQLSFQPAARESFLKIVLHYITLLLKTIQALPIPSFRWSSSYLHLFFLFTLPIILFSRHIGLLSVSQTLKRKLCLFPTLKEEYHKRSSPFELWVVISHSARMMKAPYCRTVVHNFLEANRYIALFLLLWGKMEFGRDVASLGLSVNYLCCKLEHISSYI